MQLFETSGGTNVVAAVAAGADGIMLEVHPDPENSAVDPLQPINYEHFGKLIKNGYDFKNNL